MEMPGRELEPIVDISAQKIHLEIRRAFEILNTANGFTAFVRVKTEQAIFEIKRSPTPMHIWVSELLNVDLPQRWSIDSRYIWEHLSPRGKDIAAEEVASILGADLLGAQRRFTEHANLTIRIPTDIGNIGIQISRDEQEDFDYLLYRKFPLIVPD